MPAQVDMRTRSGFRAKVVWSVLLGAMSAVVGVLVALDAGRPGAHAPGVSLSPLLSVEGTRGVDLIFNTDTPVEEGRWDSIVIVHSGSPAGSPESIGARHARLGYDGLGFHIVIGNGTGMGDGEIHLGRRWITQSDGAALAGIDPKATGSMIELCLVGNGDRRPFTDEQIRYLATIVDAIRERTGIGRDRVLLHADIAATTSPGRYFPRSAFRSMLAAD